MKFEEMKKGIKPLLVECCQVTEEEAEEAIYDTATDDVGIVEQSIAQQLGILEPTMEIYGFEIDDKEFMMHISSISEVTGEHLALLMFNSDCSDVKGANCAMDEYMQSQWGDLLSIENAVESEQDFLTLSYTFYAKNSAQFRNEMSKVFDVLRNDEFVGLLGNILVHFED